MVSWDVTPCPMVETCHHFRLTHCLPTQGRCLQSWRRMQHVTSKCRWHLLTKIHGVTSQGTVNFTFTSARNSELTKVSIQTYRQGQAISWRPYNPERLRLCTTQNFVASLYTQIHNHLTEREKVRGQKTRLRSYPECSLKEYRPPTFEEM